MSSSSTGSNIMSFNAPRSTSLDGLLPQHHFLNPLRNSLRNTQRDQLQMRMVTNISVHPRIIFERPLPAWIGVSDGDGLGAVVLFPVDGLGAVVLFPVDGLGAVVLFPVDNGGNKALPFDEDKVMSFDEIVCDCSTFIEFPSSCRWGMVLCKP